MSRISFAGTLLAAALTSCPLSAADQPAAGPARTVYPPLVLEPQQFASFTLSPDGRTVATVGRDRSIRLWDVYTNQMLRELRGSEGTVVSVAFSPDGQRLVACCDGSISAAYFWEVHTGKLVLGTAEFLPRPALGNVRYSPDGNWIALGNDDGGIIRYHAKTGAQDGGYQEINLPIVMTAYSPDSKVIAAANSKGQILFMNAFKTTNSFTSTEQRGLVLTLEFAPDGKTLATAGPDGKVVLRDGLRGKVLREWAAHKGAVLCLHYLPDWSILTGGADQVVRVWDGAGKKLHELPLPLTTSARMSLSPGGRWLGSVTGDGWIVVWPTELLRQAPPKPAPLSAAQLEDLWKNLATSDAVTRYRTMAVFAANPKQSLPWLRERLKPAEPDPIEADVLQLIKDLDHKQFRMREKAAQLLEQRGRSVEKSLRVTLKRDPSAETRRRLTQILDRLGKPTPELPTPEQLRDRLTIAILEHIATAETRAVLEMLATGAPEAPRTAQAREALDRLKRAEKKTH